jgi:hypothetical protein
MKAKELKKKKKNKKKIILRKNIFSIFLFFKENIKFFFFLILKSKILKKNFIYSPANDFFLQFPASGTCWRRSSAAWAA